VQLLKYAVQNVATATARPQPFMPKPLVGDNGSGMHVHQSLQKEGKALFAGTDGDMSDSGALLHGRHHQARQGAETPSPTPVPTATSAWCPASRRRCCSRLLGANRSASTAFRGVSSPKARRIEVASPDFPQRQPVLSPSRADDDGRAGWHSQNKIHPGDRPTGISTILEPEGSEAHSNRGCHSLDSGARYLDKDREFLTRRRVFTTTSSTRTPASSSRRSPSSACPTHPIELELYYSCWRPP